MVFKTAAERYYALFLFLIIPVIFMLGARSIHYNRGDFFMINTDPEYFFLYNGALVGGGNLSVDYTSNPGTPLMVLIGISSRMVSLFHPGNYYEDIVNDPEKYIHAANLLLVFLIALTLFIGGWYVWKVTGSMIAGLLLQMALPGSTSLMFLASMMKAEVMTILPVLLLSLAVYRYVFKEQGEKGTSNKTLAMFGMIGGFGMACKLIFIPLVLIPFILLKTSVGQKIKLLLYTLLSFAVFAYPVVFNNGKFWSWIADIFSHTGKYGAGQKGFIDLASVPGNLYTLFDNDRAFFYITGLSLVAGIVSCLAYRRNPSQVQRRLGLALLAVSVAVVACIALVLKHFEVHYFFPVYVLKYIMISLVFILLIRAEKIGTSRIVKGIATGILLLPVIYISYQEVIEIQSSNRYVIARKIKLEEKYRKVMLAFETSSPLIISGRFNGAPFPEFAHYEGFKMSFKLRKSFIPHLKARYPVSYQYVDWDRKFYYWDSFVDMQTILARTSRSFYVFIGEGKAADLPKIEERIWQVADKNAVARDVVYQDPETGDQLIKYTLPENDPAAVP